MSLLVRKINKAKWQVEAEKYVLPASADSITRCLTTTKNTLSFWLVREEAAVEEAVLAIAASNDSLDTIDVVVIPQSKFEESGFVIEETEGLTACKDLAQTHRDLAKLNVKHLDKLSEMIVEELQRGKVKRYTLPALRKLIQAAIEAGRIVPEELKDGVRRKVTSA